MSKKVTGTLAGCDGNAFMLMGYFQKLAKKQGWTFEEISEVIQEAKSGDYDHLIQTLDSRMEAEA